MEFFITAQNSEDADKKMHQIIQNAWKNAAKEFSETKTEEGKRKIGLLFPPFVAII